MTVKRFISVITLLAAYLLSLAQVPSLRGTWENEIKEMGLEGVVAYEFDGDSEGPVSFRASVSMDINSLGLIVNGSITMTFAGAFSYDGDTLALIWDKESMISSSTPITMRYKDEDAPDEMKEKMEKSLQNLAESMKTMMDVSAYQCSVTKDRLTLSRVDSEGKVVSKKYRHLPR